jgi:PAS domain S-box-containing protein
MSVVTRKSEEFAVGGPNGSAQTPKGQVFPFSQSRRGGEQPLVPRAETERARAATVLECVSDGVVAVDADWRFTWVNPTAEQIIGRRRDELLARVLWDALPESIGPLGHECRRAMADRIGIEFEGPVELQNRWFEIKVFPSEDGGLFVYFRDITARKRVEHELAGRCEQLEQLLAERSASLNRSLAQLRRTERLASLGTFVAGVAHEIIGPLNAIGLAAECGLRDAQKIDADENFRTIKTQVQRAARMSRDLLSFAHNERTPKLRGNVNDVVRRAVRLARTYVPSMKTQFDLDLGPDLPPVLMNATGIEQVLVNLIKNAADARGGARLAVRTGCADGKVRLIVADDGPGIRPEVLRHIFDPFFTTKGDSGGTGLGLSICHGIVADHDGTLTVDSEVGRGTTFSIELPSARLPERV